MCNEEVLEALYTGVFMFTGPYVLMLLTAIQGFPYSSTIHGAGGPLQSAGYNPRPMCRDEAYQLTRVV